MGLPLLFFFFFLICSSTWKKVQTVMLGISQHKLLDRVDDTIFLSPFLGNDGKKFYFKKSHCLPWERKLRVTFQPNNFFLTSLTRSQNIRTWNFYKRWDMITSLPHNQWVQIQICFSYQLADFDGLIIECIFFFFKSE